MFHQILFRQLLDPVRIGGQVLDRIGIRIPDSLDLPLLDSEHVGTPVEFPKTTTEATD